jgi:hypothetical protein
LFANVKCATPNSQPSSAARRQLALGLFVGLVRVVGGCVGRSRNRRRKRRGIDLAGVIGRALAACAIAARTATARCRFGPRIPVPVAIAAIERILAGSGIFAFAGLAALVGTVALRAGAILAFVTPAAGTLPVVAAIVGAFAAAIVRAILAPIVLAVVGAVVLTALGLAENVEIVVVAVVVRLEVPLVAATAAGPRIVLARLVVRDDAEIVVGELQVVLGLHPVAVMRGVLGKLLVLVEHLRSIAPGAAVDAVLVATALRTAAATAATIVAIVIQGKTIPSQCRPDDFFLMSSGTGYGRMTPLAANPTGTRCPICLVQRAYTRTA